MRNEEKQTQRQDTNSVETHEKEEARIQEWGEVEEKLSQEINGMGTHEKGQSTIRYREK